MLASSHSTRTGRRQQSIPALLDSKASLWVIRLFCFQSDTILCFLGNYNLFIFFLPSNFSSLSLTLQPDGHFWLLRTCCGSAFTVLWLVCSKEHHLHPPILEQEKQKQKNLFKTLGTWKRKYLQLTNVVNDSRKVEKMSLGVRRSNSLEWRRSQPDFSWATAQEGTFILTCRLQGNSSRCKGVALDNFDFIWMYKVKYRNLCYIFL